MNAIHTFLSASKVLEFRVVRYNISYRMTVCLLRVKNINMYPDPFSVGSVTLKSDLDEYHTFNYSMTLATEP